MSSYTDIAQAPPQVSVLSPTQATLHVAGPRMVGSSVASPQKHFRTFFCQARKRRESEKAEPSIIRARAMFVYTSWTSKTLSQRVSFYSRLAPHLQPSEEFSYVLVDGICQNTCTGTYIIKRRIVSASNSKASSPVVSIPYRSTPIPHRTPRKTAGNHLDES